MQEYTAIFVFGSVFQFHCNVESANKRKNYCEAVNAIAFYQRTKWKINENGKTLTNTDAHRIRVSFQWDEIFSLENKWVARFFPINLPLVANTHNYNCLEAINASISKWIYLARTHSWPDGFGNGNYATL